MGKGEYLGEFELLVMATVVRLGDDDFGLGLMPADPVLGCANPPDCQ